MPKACDKCEGKSMKGIYKTTEKESFRENYPETASVRGSGMHGMKTRRIKITLPGLKPDLRIFYFAPTPSNTIKDRDTAYGSLKNSGVCQVNKDGVAEVKIYCPGIYVNPETRAYPRHFHFCYWDTAKKEWGHRLYTRSIFCTVSKAFVKAAIDHKSHIIIDALPSDYYNKKHIPTAINVPHTKPLSMKSLIKAANGKYTADELKRLPIILYCYSPTCNAAEHLKEKLDRLGVLNTYHFSPGIKGW